MEAKRGKVNLAFIPLDDRPCCWRFPVMLGDLVGWSLSVPPSSLLGTFLTPGQPTALLSWLQATQGRMDASLVSFDMLLYGGLVASRSSHGPTHVDVEAVLAVLHQGPPCFTNNVLMRVAPTATRDSDIRFTQRLHEYSRRCAVGGDSAAIADEFPPGYLDSYLSTRRRNHEANAALLQAAALHRLEYLLIGIDDSKTVGLNVLERHQLDPLVSAASAICPGTDELAHLLLARMSGEQPRIHVIWSHPRGPEATPLYEDRPFKALVQAQVNVSGGVLTDDKDNADILLFAHVHPSGQKEAAEQLGLSRRDAGHKPLVAAIENAVRDGRCVAVADMAYANGGDLAFCSLLQKSVPLLGLDAYSGWNTAGNALGTALASATLRYHWKTRLAPAADTATQEACEGAHMRFMMNRWLDDVVYQPRVRQEARLTMVPMGVSSFNLGESWRRVEGLVAKRMQAEGEKLFDSSFRGQVSGTVKVQGDFRMQARLPWPRLFEIDLECQARVQQVG